MLSKLLIGFSLMALCVMIHATGLTLVFRWMQNHLAREARDFWTSAAWLVGVATWTVFLHLIQILLWAGYYAAAHAMPDLNTALYFSVVTYTTTGYGDLVLPAYWRIVGGIEPLTGILMCGLSTGMFFAAFARIFRVQPADAK